MDVIKLSLSLQTLLWLSEEGTVSMNFLLQLPCKKKIPPQDFWILLVHFGSFHQNARLGQPRAVLIELRVLRAPLSSILLKATFHHRWWSGQHGAGINESFHHLRFLSAFQITWTNTVWNDGGYTAKNTFAHHRLVITLHRWDGHQFKKTIFAVPQFLFQSNLEGSFFQVLKVKRRFFRRTYPTID